MPGNESESCGVLASVYMVPWLASCARADWGCDAMYLAASRECRPSTLISSTCGTTLPDFCPLLPDAKVRREVKSERHNVERGCVCSHEYSFELGSIN